MNVLHTTKKQTAIHASQQTLKQGLSKTVTETL